MMMRMLVLISVVLLVSPAVTRPRRGDLHIFLDKMYEEATTYETPTEPMQQDFLEDVSHLAEGTNKCGDMFFCKVRNILHGYHRTANSTLLRNLKQYLSHTNTNCTAMTTASPAVQKTLPALMRHLKSCIQNRHLHGTKTPVTSTRLP